MKKVVVMLLLLWSTLLVADQAKAMIIFDASGSMWGQIAGKTKIEIAREALARVVRTWNPDVELGLTVYGHRSKGDCNDIETLIPVGKVQSYHMISAVNAIQPKGKTPISRSIRKAADALRYTEEKATIILISDGQETCDPDPCGTAKQLKAEGIDFVAHVIGFNVDKKTDEELQCIASATGGEYYSAKNANALNDAMKTIVQKVEKVEPPKPEPKPVVKELDHTVEISASETEGGKWIRAYHYIYPMVDGKPEDSMAASGNSN
ncbi:MAG: VWA domain-containing protein, partial [Campylobacterales bacterium]|nr:VWA domain-containing protein [Campylobacterales bacterium]